jgi:hypothetical protein
MRAAAAGKVFGGLLVLAAVVAVPASQAQAQTDTFHFTLRDHAINAAFIAADECFVSTTFINYGEAVDHVHGEPDIQAITLVEVTYNNACTGDQFTLTGGTTNQTVTIQGNLSAATLSAVVPLTDGTITVNANINISLASSGELQQVNDVFNSHGNGTVFHQSFNFEAMPATPTGSVTVTLPLSTGDTTVQLSPGSTNDLGLIAKNTFGTVVINHHSH